MRLMFALLTALGLMAAGAAAAQPQSETNLSLGYDGRLVLKVLDIGVEERLGPTGFGASAHLKPYGVLALFKKFDVQATTQAPVVGGQLQPAAFFYENHDGKRDRKVHVAWSASEVTVSSTPPYADLGSPPATLAQKLAAADPLAQLVRISLTPPGGDPCAGGERLFFDGKQLYALDFVQAQPASLPDDQQQLGLTKAVQCRVKFREVAGFKPKPPSQRNQGLKRAISVTFGELGDTGPWLIATMQAETPLGPAYIQLRRLRRRGT